MKIAGIYTLFGLLWILFSDRFLLLFTDDVNFLAELQTIKGWLFIVVTAGLLYILVRQTLATQYRSVLSLRQSEKHFRTLLDTIPDLIWLKDAEGVYLSCNATFESLFGAKEAEIVGKTDYDFVDKELADFFREKDRKAMQDGKPSSNEEWVTFAEDGRRALLFTTKTPMYDSAGSLIGVLGVGREITERKQAEEKLKNEQFRLSEIIRGTNVGTWEWNVISTEVNFNDRWAEIIGRTRDEITPLTVATLTQLIHPEDMKKRNEQLEKLFRHERDYYDLELRMKHKDGHWHWCQTRGKVSSWTDDGKPRLMFGTLADIDERKRIEEERQTIEKLNTVGTLAGGLAHDFNNILAGLYGNISLAKTKLSGDHAAAKFLEAAEKSMNRATLLTNQLLTFAKGGSPVKENLSLAGLIEEIVNFNLSGSNVKPVIDTPENLWLIEADQGQMQQVFGNLTINAKQAMPNGGHLHIALENAEMHNPNQLGLESGKYLKITVADEGLGIAPEHRDRIFEPYFTTKQTGSGLGLATIYSIIKQHRGHISVASELNRGTTFTLYLPAAGSQNLPQKTPEAIFCSMQNRSAKILVMDDEEMIRDTLTLMLKELCLAVTTCADGQQALALYQQAQVEGKPFDLVILDLTIPGGIGGKETARNILQLDSKAKLVVSSGYAEDPIMSNYADYGFSGVITKPYDLNKMSIALNRLLTTEAVELAQSG